ncbi:MAG: hypothetical protein HOG03_09540 [Desulfobacula sp.]|jgi:hypothetical protein|nr:hypothetical protein [Desulfobacula sp.]MBT3485484.1 hypothetical protein [Desulfobacula sp.]MBT3804830.1 hypothetical protein [Desulfobacula sp.]MBT4026191.1 hypothetical protein [Desulfobacula sp.]MBT4199756.1 hypothetical protein [Desulfobacula sp.]
MLFPYVYIPHPMEIMKHFLDFIFYEVWCKAPESGPYDLALFDDMPELKELMESFHYSDAKGADFFNGHIERIYQIFSTLSAHQISQLISWYEANNNLEKICCNDPSIAIVRYKDLEAFHTGLARQLTAFFKGLYSQDLLNLSALREKISQIEDHYKKFIMKNNSGKCPFCGIMDIKGIYHSKREAYDHYLPKSIYPFNSINFKNLVPACHECNSTYKLSKDPVFKPKDPLLSATKGIRKAFYPYADRSYQIKLQLDLKCKDWSDITPEDIEFSAGPDELKEEISTWNDVYGIEERYKAKCCGENDGKGWIREVVDESQNYGLSPLEYLDGKLKTAENDPWVDDNFLKKPFLQACQKAGLFGK